VIPATLIALSKNTFQGLRLASRTHTVILTVFVVTTGRRGNGAGGDGCSIRHLSKVMS